jgi:hypothetical protein
MTPEKLMNDLQRVVDKQYPILVGKFPIKSLSLSKKEINNIMMNMRHGDKGVTEGPIEIVYNIQSGQFNILEGYHRVVEFISKKKEFIPAKIWSTSHEDFLTNVSNDDLFFKPVPINSFVHSFSILKETYHDKQSDDEKTKNAELYFSIGQEGPNSVTDKNYCWIWDGNNVISKMGATHGLNFSHQVANRNFKGWYDAAKNIISVVFPEHELRKLGNRRPTEDDIPQYLYQKLISQFGKRKPRIVVFESKNYCCISKNQLKVILKEITKHVLKEDEDSEKHNEFFWMTPSLTFQKVPFEGHWDWAAHYLRSIGRPINFTENSYDKMYNLGFVRVSKIGYLGAKILAYNYKKESPLSPQRTKTLRDFAIEHGCDILRDDTLGKSEELFEEYEIPYRPYGGWLDSDLKFHKVDFEGHRSWALSYLEHHHPEERKLRMGETTNDKMYRLGFIRVVIDGDNVFYQYKKENPPEPRKVKAIKDLAIEYQCKSVEDSETGKIEDLLQEIKLHPPITIIVNESINETMTYKELLGLTTDDRKERASNVNVRSIPVSVEEGQEQWNFRYKSSPQTTITDEPFEGHILFLKGEVEQGNNAMDLECKVDCGCPDFMYRFAYNDTQKGASDVGPDSLSGCANRRPKPAYDYGEGLCKHLAALSRYLRTKISATKKSNLFEAVSDVAKQGPFNVTYYDD